jgi:probable HAF family extracellular repeat protein
MSTYSKLVLASLLVFTSSSVSAFNYSLIDLGTIGGIDSVASDLNDQGQITGWSTKNGIGSSGTAIPIYTDNGVMKPITDFLGLGAVINNQGQSAGYFLNQNTYTVNAFVTRGSEFIDLGGLGGFETYARAINDSGQVAGVSSLPGAHQFDFNTSKHAFYTVNDVIHDLGTFGGASSYANDINNIGQVTGSAQTVEGHWHAFLAQNGNMTDIGTLGGNESAGMRVNNVGQVMGNSSTSNGNNHAFLYQNGSMTDLGTLGGDISYGYDLNEKGQVVGGSSLSDGGIRAFVTVNDVMTDLGTLGGDKSIAYQINNLGQVLGISRTSNNDVHAFITEGGVLIDLNTIIENYFGWDLRLGIDPLGWPINDLILNNKGQIAGQGYNPSGERHAFLLTPLKNSNNFVSEPTTIYLLLIGFALMIYLPMRFSSVANS